MHLLVTGGAGYIGSHFVTRAIDNGFSEITVVDDLSTGYQSRLPSSVRFQQLDLADDSITPKLTNTLRDIDAVVHFAAKKAVGESVTSPEKYFRNNIGGTINLLSAMREAHVTKLIFSSSAAVYGEPDSPVVYETTPCRPINPYGQSKRISELSLENAAAAWGLQAVSLRYFNVAGALNSLLADTTTSNLMPAIRSRMTEGNKLQVYGSNYDTPDGTCIRDYIHILDLVDAHLVALRNLNSKHEPMLEAFNVGTGFGSSVLEIVTAFQSLPGIDLEYEYAARRPGDPGALTANVDKIAKQLSWHADFNTGDIVQSVVDHPPLGN